MSLGREIQEFVGAFSGTANAFNAFETARDRRERRKEREAKDPNKSPEMKQAYDAYKATGGQQPMGALPLAYNQTEDYGNYADGGLVDELRQPIPNPNRTAAFNPETETIAGPPAPAPVPQQALPITPPGNVSQPVGNVRGEPYSPTAGGEGGSPNVAADLEAALKGGMEFAMHNFHLKGEGAMPMPSAHAERGKQALMTGVGAATPQMVEAIDAKVNANVPRDETVWGIRRLEALYRFYSNRGETDKANKAAFELIQYSAGEAAKYGNLALEDIKAGNTNGAINNVVQGHAYIPDGHKLEVQGSKAVVKDARTGATVQEFQFTPQQLFTAAMGLKNRSLYWDVLMQRANTVGKRASTQTPAQEELTKARTDLVKARTDRLGKTPIKGAGGGGGGGISPAGQAIIDKIGEIGAARGKKTDGGPISTPATAPASDGTTTGGGDPDDEDGRALESPPDLKSADEGVPAKPTYRDFAAAAMGKIKPEKFDPEGDGYDYETARAAGLKPDATGHWPSRDPNTGVLLKGKAHETFKLGTDEDAKLGYTVRKREDGRYESQQDDPDFVPEKEYVREGGKYVPPPAKGAPLPFDQPEPGKPRPFAEEPMGDNPYKALRAQAAKIPGKEGKTVQAYVEKQVKDFDAETKQWDNRRKEHLRAEQHRFDTDQRRFDVAKRTHEGNERRRVETEYTQTRADQKEKLRAEYDYKPKPHERDQIVKDVDAAFEASIARAKLGGLDPDKLDDSARKKAEADNKKKFGQSVFADAKVDPQRFKAITADIMTSNPTPDANTATRIVANLTRIDPNDARVRAYKVRGRDPLGNVILEVPQFGAVHVRQDTFKEITSIIKDRLSAAADAGKKTALDAAEKAAPSKVTKAREAATDALGRMPIVGNQGKGQTLVDDVKDVARRAVGAIPGGDPDKFEERYKGRAKNYGIKVD